MRYPAAEKLEIIRLVEGSHLPVRRTLARIGSRPSVQSPHPDSPRSAASSNTTALTRSRQTVTAEIQNGDEGGMSAHISSSSATPQARSCGKPAELAREFPTRAGRVDGAAPQDANRRARRPADVQRRDSGGLLRALFLRDVEPAAAQPTEALTQREGEVLQLIGEGLSNKEIATALSLSIATVKHHVHNVLHKLNLARRPRRCAASGRRPGSPPRR